MNYAANIAAVWARVDAIDRVEGLLAYPRYRDTLGDLATRYGCQLAPVVAAFAALSPNSDYVGNLRSVVTLLEGRRAGIPVDRCTVSTYNACRDRAWAFLNGTDFLAVTKGPKTRNFYRNILDPSDPEPVTIDGHMVGIAYGQRMIMRDVIRTKFRYAEIADAFRSSARVLGLLPNQLQATLWFTWKRLHDVVYEPQLDAFLGDNQWRCAMDLSWLRPYRHGSIELAPVEPVPNGTHDGESLFGALTL